MSTYASPRSGHTLPLWQRVSRERVAQVMNFGMIGAIAFVVDFGIYNLLRITILDDKPIGAKVASVAVATLVAWIGNRQLTFRSERKGGMLREAVLFAIMNVVGLAIAAACLFVSHYLLGYTSQLADNVAGNGIGLVLGTIFRFLAYRLVVFRAGPVERVLPSTAPVLSS